jgi:hypothetical protein
MVSLNENTVMKEYMGVTDCSEQHARSVYIILDAVRHGEGAEGGDRWETLEPWKLPEGPVAH